MKVRVSDWVEGDGVIGYEAVMECRRVQVERPRAVMSGGQSEGGPATGTGVVVGLRVDLVREKREETSVQVRQLGAC